MYWQQHIIHISRSQGWKTKQTFVTSLDTVHYSSSANFRLTYCFVLYLSHFEWDWLLLSQISEDFNIFLSTILLVVVAFPLSVALLPFAVSTEFPFYHIFILWFITMQFQYHDTLINLTEASLLFQLQNLQLYFRYCIKLQGAVNTVTTFIVVWATSSHDTECYPWASW
jgi:hypothetical protein